MIFGAINTAGTGLVAYRQWMDAVSDNLSNISDTSSTSGPAYQARSIEVQARPGSDGVNVVGAAFGSAQGQVVYKPTDPLADKNGDVRVPDIDMGDQMAQLIEAQRGYEANLSTVKSAQEMYSQAISIGKNS
jgi:flagellar basal-body rod protein FlgC